MSEDKREGPMSKEEFQELRNPNSPSSPSPVPSTTNTEPTTTARDFILGRSKEIIAVPLSGPDGTYEIKIRARLTKREVKVHRKFLSMFANPEAVSESDAEVGASKFLAAITLDETLDEEFWMSDEIDPYIAQELLTAFMVKAASVLESVKKFRTVR